MVSHSPALFFPSQGFQIVFSAASPSLAVPLLRRKESGVLSSTSFKGGHSLQDLLYILAKFVVFYPLREDEGMHGV